MGSANNRGETERCLKRHGLLGWYRAGSGATDQGQADSSPSLGTLFPTETLSGADFSLTSTGDICALPTGGAVAIAGRPVFRDHALAAIASESGAAAAVANAYNRLGESLFTQVHGAFACCIVDTSKQRVLAAIDRLGQHSLYYRTIGDAVLFASEARELLQITPDEPALLNQGIYNYVYFHMVPSTGTVYRDISKLAAANYLLSERGRINTEHYWLPEFSESKSGRSVEVLGEELKAVLKRAVQRSIPADTRIGAFLSGGLDSSTVTGVMSELCDQSAEAYSIGFSADGYDEMAFARITANHFGVKLNEYYVTPEDVVEALPMIATSYDEPFGNSSALPAYFCARMAAENGVDTLLAGDGGDEIFAGNERYLKQRVFDHYALLPKFLRSGLIEPIVRALPNSFPLATKASSYISQANTPLPDRLQSYNFLHRHAAKEIFADDFLAEVDTQYPLELQRGFYHRPTHGGDLNRMLYLDWQFTLANNDLRKVSHMCAVAGVDVTYPMLDDELVEFSCQVPSDWKIQGQDLRHFYKHALTDWLPHETIHKNKQGFGLPFGVWMSSYKPLRDMAYDHLNKLKGRDFICPDFIERAIKMHQSEHAAYYGELVWILTVFELWISAQPTSGPKV